MGFASRVTRYQGRRRKPLKIPAFLSPSGMRDSRDPQTGLPRKSFLHQNVYPHSAKLGKRIVGRPGLRLMGSQLGSGSDREGQRVYQYTQLDGTEYTLGFAGGLMYSFDWSTRTWTNIPLSGVSLPSSGRIYCETIANELIVNPNDGTNKPWSWDGTNFTELSNAPLAYGQPVKHYSKLFFIKWEERNTLCWSEEEQPNVGYEATIGPTTYDNAWTLGQTDEEAFYRLVSTENRLYCFRGRSITWVRGRVNADFSSFGARDGIVGVGTTSPDAVVLSGNLIYFVDSDQRPQSIAVGGGLLADPAIWEECEYTLKGMSEDQSAATAIDWQPGGLVRFGFIRSGQTEIDRVLHFNATTGEFTGIDLGYSCVTMDMVKNADGVLTGVHLTSDGYAYEHGHPEGTIWSDGFEEGAQPIDHRVIGTWHGWDTDLEKLWAEVDFSFNCPTALTGLTLTMNTKYGRSADIVVDLDPTLPIFGRVDFGEVTFGGRTGETHLQVGFEMSGRWAQVSVRHYGLAERFELNGWRPTAYPAGSVPETP